MSENSNNKSTKYWCNMFNMSKKQRNVMLQTEREQGYWSFGDLHPEHSGVLFNVYGAEKRDGTRSEKWLTVDEFEQRNEQLKANSRNASKTRTTPTTTTTRANTKPKVFTRIERTAIPIEAYINQWQNLYDMEGESALDSFPKWIKCHLKLKS